MVTFSQSVKDPSTFFPPCPFLVKGVGTGKRCVCMHVCCALIHTRKNVYSFILCRSFMALSNVCVSGCGGGPSWWMVGSRTSAMLVLTMILRVPAGTCGNTCDNWFGSDRKKTDRKVVAFRTHLVATRTVFKKCMGNA